MSDGATRRRPQAPRAHRATQKRCGPLGLGVH
jgi:hypothetical protein